MDGPNLMQRGQPRRLKRFAFFLTGDIVLLTGALILSFFTLGLTIRDEFTTVLLVLLWFIALTSKILMLLWNDQYRINWSFVGLEDMVRLSRAITLSSSGLILSTIVAQLFGWLPEFSIMILLTDFAFSLVAIGAFRLSRRIYFQIQRRDPSSGHLTLIVGAGAAGEQLTRSLLASPQAGYVPIGILDDDLAKQGTMLHGVKVIGQLLDLRNLLQNRVASKVVIAMPSAPPGVVRQVVAEAQAGGADGVGILPSLPRVIQGKLVANDVREVQLEDLLGRAVVNIDLRGVAASVAGKKVLVTGAGGTIGSEIASQLVKFGPSALMLLDHEETSLFEIHKRLESVSFATANGTDENLAPVSVSDIVPMLADIRDVRLVNEIFKKFRPDAVFHAAAYKHVGLLERMPKEAVRTNVFGTIALAEASVANGAQRFVLISTDKAVAPTSVMGATKRVAEQVCLAMNKPSSTQFMAVRFGNVLGSRGSVVPIFQENIRNGGPITVRGLHVRRYFMAVSEAVRLVLQVGAMGEGGEVYVLDMGPPVKILDLAKDLIRLSGLEPDKDIAIKITSLEPGEKEFEDILNAEDGTIQTHHENIFRARQKSPEAFSEVLDAVIRLRDSDSREMGVDLLNALRDLVPAYSPSATALSAVR